MASVDSSDIPAGFFSTFSIADPYNPAPGNIVKAQKRNRRVFVCIPCHRRKLKCDKLLPCSRCVAAEIADECSYMPPPSPVSRAKKRRDRKAAGRGRPAKDAARQKKAKVKRESSPALSASSFSSLSSSFTPSPSPSPSPSPAPSLDLPSPQSTTVRSKMRVHTSKSISSSRKTSYPASEDEDGERLNFDKLRGKDSSSSVNPLNGASHWSRIACEFHDAVPYLFGTDMQWQQRYRQVKSLKCLFPSLDDNINFPFSNTNPASKVQILNSLPPNHIVDTLVGNYFETFGATHCLFHPAQLRYEIRQFYDAPSDVSDEWLAQLCMILALGAESTADFLFSGSGQSAAEWAVIFLNASQASFGRSSYMVAPTLSTVRTLCMMVLAKLIEAPASGGSCSGNSGGSGCSSDGGRGVHGGGNNKAFNTNGYIPLVSLMAFTMRMATSLQLHRSTTTATTTAPATTTPAKPHSTGGIRADKQATGSVDTEMRRRIWVTVRLLDLDTALRTGTVSMQRRGTCDMELPQPLSSSNMTCGDNDCANVYNTSGCFRHSMCEGTECCYSGGVLKNDYGCKDESKTTTTTTTSAESIDKKFHGDADGLYQYKLATFFPLLAKLVNVANSPTKPNPGYARVKDWDTRTRKFLDGTRTALISIHHAFHHGMENENDVGWQQQNHVQQQGMFDNTVSVGQMKRATIQYQYLETLTHRALLALHHNSFCQSLSLSRSADESNRTAPETSARYTMSQAAVVESSLALLSTYKAWAAAVADLADRCSSTCTNMTAAATAASVDTPFSSMLHLAGGGGGSVGSMLGLIKSTAAEMIIQQQQQQMPISLSARSSPTIFGGGSDVTATATVPTAAAATAPMMHNTGWLLDLCHDDFGAALMYMVLVLRAVHCQAQIQIQIQQQQGHGHGLLGCHQEEAAAVTAVRHSYQIIRDRSYRSVAHFKEFLGVAILFACFRGLRSGDMLSQVIDATNDVEQVIVTGRRYLMWAADSFTAPDEAALMGFTGPLMVYGGI